MLSCRELVDETTADPDLVSAGHPLRWSIRLHLLMCHHCRRYTRQLRRLLHLLSDLQRRQQPIGAATVEQIWQAIESRRGE